MTEDERKIEDNALAFIKRSKKELLARFCPPAVCRPTANPITLFMAGSPGAGKTEVSRSLVKRFQDQPMRIDADEIRSICPGYTGDNAHLFQKAASKGVNMLYDHALAESINCIMDGTFAYGDAAGNVERALRHKRRVQVWFVYQDPVRAWELTKAREKSETRHVSRELFVKAFFRARENVRAVKEQFGDEVTLNFLAKDYFAGTEDLKLNIPAGALDRLIDVRYAEDTLMTLLV
jgi:predicted ABC-type ATPase